MTSIQRMMELADTKTKPEKPAKRGRAVKAKKPRQPPVVVKRQVGRPRTEDSVVGGKTLLRLGDELMTRIDRTWHERGLISRAKTIRVLLEEALDAPREGR